MKFSSRRLHRGDIVDVRPRRTLPGRYFIVAVYDLPRARVPKFSFVVAKKIAPLASDRNHIKRLGREAVTQHLSRFKKPLGLLFRANKGAATASLSDLSADVEKLLRALE